jgi:putative peptide zinc metalloprotease protein
MIRVAQGQQVQHGDILLELANDNIIHRCREVELELVESQFRSDYLLSTGDITSHRAEMVEQETLRHRLWEANKLLEKLTVRAPNNGIVIAQDIENLQGQFLNEGDPVCVVGEPNSLAIRLLIPQQVIDAVTELKGQVGRVTFAGNMCHEGEAPLVSIDPRGTLDILHPALAANSGGPIAIQPSVSGRVELVEPHFIGTAALPLCIQDHCASGQLVNFQIAVSRMTILEVVRNLLQYKFK